MLTKSTLPFLSLGGKVLLYLQAWPAGEESIEWRMLCTLVSSQGLQDSLEGRTHSVYPWFDSRFNYKLSSWCFACSETHQSVHRPSDGHQAREPFCQHRSLVDIKDPTESFMKMSRVIFSTREQIRNSYHILTNIRPGQCLHERIEPKHFPADPTTTEQ